MAFRVIEITFLFLLSYHITGAIRTQQVEEDSDTSTEKGNSHTPGRCTSNSDCKLTGEICHNTLNVCFPERQPVQDIKKPTIGCHSNTQCGHNKICHSIFNICVENKINQPANKRQIRPRKVIKCSASEDCKVGQFCYNIFSICVDRPKRYAMAYRSASITHTVKCSNDTQCPEGKYCHRTHRMCLNKVPVSTSSKPKQLKCQDQHDCSSDEYCHSHHHLCLKPLPPDEPLTGVTQEVTNQVTTCNVKSDCKDTESCHVFGPRARRRLARVACHDLPSSKLTGRGVRDFSPGCSRQRTITGICLDTKLLLTLKDQAENCSSHSDCGANMCCIKNKGVCMNNRRAQEMCVMQDVWFSCPCSDGLTCVSKGKKINARKLSERLELPREVSKELTTSKEIKRKKFEVGKCQKTRM